ncbi:hypothetical protein COOONC_23783 [Cooperia oncophora]
MVDTHSRRTQEARLSFPILGDGINQWNYIVTGIPKLRRFQFVYNIDEHGSAIRDGDFKLILGNPDRRIQEDHGKARLYRVTEDPGESNDLSKIHPGIVQRLKAKIAELQKYMRKNVRKPLSLKGSPERLNGTYGSYWCT